MEILIGIAVVCFALVGAEIAGRGVNRAHERYDKWITEKLVEKVNRRRSATSK